MNLGRFLSLTVFFIVAAGLSLHYQVEIPFIPKSVAQWIGHLPGDLVIKKEGKLLYVPLATSALLSAVLLLLFRKKGN